MRFRISPDGGLEVVDPDPQSLAVIQAIDPAFTVKQRPLKGFDEPRLARTRKRSVGVTLEELGLLSRRTLWNIHDRQLRRTRRGKVDDAQSGMASLLDLKIELARRELNACGLCRHRCGVNRLANQIGLCGLGEAAYVAEHFLHIAEESPINPSYNLNLQGCALRCRYCQQYKLLQIRPQSGAPLSSALWNQMDLTEARSLTFVGGNPDESLYAILKFLKVAPRDFSLPVVWNCHGYAEAVTLMLLDGIVDVYIPDFKYGSESCAQKWSSVAGYVQSVRTNINRMVEQKASVFVRMLALPGHFECCHVPSLEYLSRYRDRLYLNVLSQYCPDWRIKTGDGAMLRRITSAEIAGIRSYASVLGLRLMN